MLQELFISQVTPNVDLCRQKHSCQTRGRCKDANLNEHRTRWNISHSVLHAALG